jgi:hypothetical protein
MNSTRNEVKDFFMGLYTLRIFAGYRHILISLKLRVHSMYHQFQIIKLCILSADGIYIYIYIYIYIS